MRGWPDQAVAGDHCGRSGRKTMVDKGRCGSIARKTVSEEDVKKSSCMATRATPLTLHWLQSRSDFAALGASSCASFVTVRD